MKKVDFSKDIISVEDRGASVRFLYRLKNSRSERPNMVIFTDVDGSESWDLFDDYGARNGVQKVKNFPETITFWVPVFTDCDGNLRFVSAWISECKEKPETDCSPPGNNWKWIGWKGPFTITVD